MICDLIVSPTPVQTGIAHQVEFCTVLSGPSWHQGLPVGH